MFRCGTKKRGLAALLASVWFLAGSAYAQDEAIPKPKAKVPPSAPRPAAKPAAAIPSTVGATLLVMCDLECVWRLDGENKGHLAAGGSGKGRVEFGEHVISATSPDGKDVVELHTNVTVAGQSIVELSLEPSRTARLRRAAEVRSMQMQSSAVKAFMAAGRYLEAMPILMQECDAGNINSCRTYGIWDSYGVSGPNRSDFKGQMKIWKKVCETGDAAGCEEAGSWDESSSQHDEAITRFNQACSMGRTFACLQLGQMYGGWKGIEKDLTKSESFFAQGLKIGKAHCAAGDSEDCRWASFIEEDSNGSSKNEEDAAVLLKRAKTLIVMQCEQNEAKACYQLAAEYHGGIVGIAPDKELHESYAAKACKLGWTPSCFDINN